MPTLLTEIYCHLYMDHHVEPRVPIASYCYAVLAVSFLVLHHGLDQSDHHQ